MKSHLVTADLISSVDWCLKAPDSQIKNVNEQLTWRQKAFTDLKQKLERVYGDMPLAAQRGIDFENKIYNCIKERKFEEGSIVFQNILNRLKHHTFQEKIKVTEQIEEYNCFLYGKIDAYLPADMIDIKTTANFKESSYINSYQHKLYCYGKQEDSFTYLVVEWLDFPKIKHVHNIALRIPNMKQLKEEVHTKVLETFQNIKDMALWEIYRDKYCLY